MTIAITIKWDGAGGRLFGSLNRIGDFGAAGDGYGVVVMLDVQFVGAGGFKIELPGARRWRGLDGKG